jgi:pimeloyl-ACP methyl ester carboxylesterase
MIREGFAEVPGARLRFRMAGTPTRHPLLVFENGWGASYEAWAWMERALARQVRMLFYDRAGIGGSGSSQPGSQSVAGLSAQLIAMLSALGVTERVVVVGHSYGGLIGSLHAIQQPGSVRAVVGLDSSPDQSDPVLDKQMQMVHGVAKLAILCAHLGIPDPLFCPASRRLPQPEGRLLVERSFGSVPSLRASVEELNLFNGIKATLADAKTELPHLIVSAGRASELKGWIGRVLAPPERARRIVQRMQGLHQKRVALSRHGVWEELPHDHGGLVFSETGASDSAARILEFLDSLS